MARIKHGRYNRPHFRLLEPLQNGTCLSYFLDGSRQGGEVDAESEEKSSSFSRKSAAFEL